MRQFYHELLWQDCDQWRALLMSQPPNDKKTCGLRWLAVLVILAGSGPATASVGPKLLAGCQLLGQGELAGAARQFEAAYQQDSRCAQARAGLGTVHLLQGDSQQAVADFQAVVALAPNLSLGRLGLVAAYYQLGDDQAGLKICDELLKDDLSSTEQAEVTAELAYLQCRQGLYESAIAATGQVLAAEPICPLARYVKAAALLAGQQFAEAAAATEPPLAGLSVGGLLVGDCLFAPQTYYAQSHPLAEAAPPPLVVAALPAGGEGLRHQEPDFRITSPRHGATIAESVRVRLQVKGKLDINYVAVLLGEKFVGMSNQMSFELTVMTTGIDDGWQQLRADAYDSEGNILRTATVGVVVANGNRTLTPQELHARQMTTELLRPYMLLQPYPGLWEHLRGRIWQAQGAYKRAVDDYEQAFIKSPQLPRLRGDLLAAYQQVGVPTRGSSSELHQLGRVGRAVALTFDDGPHPKITPWILDQLDRVGAKATFFLVGKQVDLYPELVREILARGHTVASHSYSHRNMHQLSALEVERELIRSRAAIRWAAGVNVTLFRPPGGHYDEAVRQATGLWGYTTVFWTANISNYAGQPAHYVKSGLLGDIQPGGVCLLHNGEDETVQILPELLQGLKQRGFKMVLLPSSRPSATLGIGCCWQQC